MTAMRIQKFCEDGGVCCRFITFHFQEGEHIECFTSISFFFLFVFFSCNKTTKF